MIIIIIIIIIIKQNKTKKKHVHFLEHPVITSASTKCNDWQATLVN